MFLAFVLLGSSLCFANTSLSTDINRQAMPLLNEKHEPTNEVMAALLSPGEFPGKRFVYISEGEEAQYCIDSSLSAKKPFAQVYPERVSWPQIAGLTLVVEKLNLKLVPKDLIKNINTLSC